MRSRNDLIVLFSITVFAVCLSTCSEKKGISINEKKKAIHYTDSAHYNYFGAWLATTKDTAGLIQFQYNYLDSIKSLTDEGSWLKSNQEAYDFVFFTCPSETDKAHAFLKRIIAAKPDSFLRLKFTANYFIGNDLYDFGDIVNCIPYLENALLISKKTGFPNPDDNDQILNTLGNVYTRMGDYKKSSKYLLEAYDYNIDRKEFNLAAKQINNLSRILYDLNLSDSAIKLLMPVLNAENVSSRRIIATLCEISRQYCNKADIDSAKIFLLKAKNKFKFLDPKDTGFVKAKINEAQQLYYSKEIKPLNYISNFRQNMINTKEEIGRDYCKQINMLANAFTKIDQLDSALYYFNCTLRLLTRCDSTNLFSLPSNQQLYAENTIMEALDAKAGIFQLLYKQKSDLKYLITAVQCYELSFEVEQKLMQYFSYDESKLLMLNESRLRSQSAIHLCYQLYQLTNNTRWAEKGFEFAEKNKAFVLLESVKRNLASNIALQNDTLYQKSQSIQLQLAYNERSIAEAQTDADKKILLEQKNKLENELLFAKTALSRQSNAYRSIMEKEDSISTTLVSSGLLNENTGLIEFFSADTVTYAFVISKNASVQFIKYPATLSDEIDSLLTFYSSSTAITNNPQAYEKAAFRLYSTLGLQQITKDWQNMIIIPDGKLCLLPFDALITEPSTTLNLQQAAYFIDQCNTVYGYSAKILIEQKGNITDQGGGIAVFAPVFTNRENNQLPLQYSYAEASSIGENNNARLFLKDKATLDNFKNQFARIGILHIATHAYTDTGISNNSKIEFIDSSLLLNELYAMHTNASLIVLSACETGIGHLNKSEGSMSLARGFYYAGAKNVITSYWNVDDKSTASLFTSFYKEINTSSYSDALHNAKKKYIENATATSASPYYWAGFVHIGLPQKNKKSNIWWWWLLALPLIAAIYYRNKKRSLVIRNY